jgi:hypothetical protein
MASASEAVMPKKGASKSAMSSLRKQPSFVMIYSGVRADMQGFSKHGIGACATTYRSRTVGIRMIEAIRVKPGSGYLGPRRLGVAQNVPEAFGGVCVSRKPEAHAYNGNGGLLVILHHGPI